MILTDYRRPNVLSYANRWAYGRNPAYADFTNFGGDCTNFASQCLYAGSGVMNYTPVSGWYYVSPDNRTASWTGASFLHRFLLSNRGPGPFAQSVSAQEILPADLIQLVNAAGESYHTLIVMKTGDAPTFNQILVSAHTFDANLRPLSTYRFHDVRFLHIKGVRKS